jgi:hypothetical protein
LHKLKGRFILSINDVPNVRKVLASFEMTPVSLTFAISGGKGTPAKEPIITGSRLNPTLGTRPLRMHALALGTASACAVRPPHPRSGNALQVGID